MIVEELVARQMLRDIIDCASYTETVRRLGFVPPSQEVDDREHSASHARLEYTRSLTDDVCTAADIAGHVLVRLASLESPHRLTGRDEEFVTAVCRAACMAVITHLTCRGVLEIP